ncbi:hypothetical protein JCM21900_003005 [Sporobolomyces salmonicolor]
MSLYTTIAPVASPFSFGFWPPSQSLIRPDSQLCGAYLSCTACGMVFLFGITYFGRFPNDRLLLKLLVVWCMLYCMIDTAVSCSWAYNWAVTSFGVPTGLAKMPWQLGFYTSFTRVCCCLSAVAALTRNLCSAFGILTSQLFYCHRIWVVSGRKNWSCVTSTLLLSLIPEGLSCYQVYWCATHDQIIDFAEIRNVTYSWLAIVLCIDVIITGALVYYMFIKPKRRAARVAVVPSPLENIWTNLAETNATSVIVQILYLSLYAAYPVDFYYTVFGFIQVKTALGSMTACINARPVSSDGFESSNSGAFESRNKGIDALRQQQSVQVTVQHQVNVDDDFDKFNADLNPSKEYSNLHAATPYKVQFHLPGLEGPRDIESGKGGNRRGDHEVEAY